MCDAFIDPVNPKDNRKCPKMPHHRVMGENGKEYLYCDDCYREVTGLIRAIDEALKGLSFRK